MLERCYTMTKKPTRKPTTKKPPAVTVVETKTAEVVATATVATAAPETEIVVFDQDQDVKVHARKITSSWQKAVSSIIETRQFLIDAKKDLPYGKFSKLFDKEIGNLPFGQDAAQRLMKIAKKKVLSNPDYSRLLPPYWRTLSTLSRAKDGQLERWIADGTVHPELAQLQAIGLLNPGAVTCNTMEEEVPLSTACSEPSDEAVAEAVQQLHQELKEEFSARKQRNENSRAELETKSVVRLLKGIDERLNDAETDWDKVIDDAGEALVRDVLYELQDRLNNYKLAKASSVH